MYPEIAILSGHVGQFLVGKQNRLGMAVQLQEIWSWKLEDLHLEDNFIDPASTLFTNIHPTHKGRQCLVA